MSGIRLTFAPIKIRSGIVPARAVVAAREQAQDAENT
jgi:hypothetical protein